MARDLQKLSEPTKNMMGRASSGRKRRGVQGDKVHSPGFREMEVAHEKNKVFSMTFYIPSRIFYDLEDDSRLCWDRCRRLVLSILFYILYSEDK